MHLIDSYHASHARSIINFVFRLYRIESVLVGGLQFQSLKILRVIVCLDTVLFAPNSACSFSYANIIMKQVLKW